MLNRTQYLVKEHVGVFKWQSRYDIIDPHTQQIIGYAQEKQPVWSLLLGMVLGNTVVPTTIELFAHGDTAPTASLTRGFTLLRSKIEVFHGNGQPVGYFKSKIMTLNGGFLVFDNQDQPIADVQGNWRSWDFKFIDNQNNELGVVSKKWMGLGKELFTSADNYMVSLHDAQHSLILLMAALALDAVFAEK